MVIIEITDQIEGFIDPTSESDSLRNLLMSEESNLPNLLMSMISHQSNTPEYKIASSSSHNHLRNNMRKDSNVFLCPHKDWFGYPVDSEIMVDSSVCTFCGIKSNCSLNRNHKPINLVIKKLFNHDNFPPESELKKCFESRSINSIIKYDPFVGFSLESNISRELFVVSKSLFEQIFGFDKDSHYHPTALQHILGFEFQTRTPIWPIDRRFLMLRNELSSSFSKGFNGLSNRESTSISDLEFEYVKRVSLKMGWIDKSEKNMFQALRHLFRDIVNILKGIRVTGTVNPEESGIIKLSKSSMKPLVDIPFDENCNGIMELALRWVILLPQDVERYLVHCNKYHTTHEIKMRLCSRIVGRELSISDEINLVDESKKKSKYFPRFPLIVITNNDGLNAINLHMTAGRVIDIVIANVSETYYLLDTLNSDISKVIDND